MFTPRVTVFRAPVVSRGRRVAAFFLMRASASLQSVQQQGTQKHKHHPGISIGHTIGDSGVSWTKAKLARRRAQTCVNLKPSIVDIISTRREPCTQVVFGWSNYLCRSHDTTVIVQPQGSTGAALEAESTGGSIAVLLLYL